jgi:nicotinamide-nucleotide amidase
LSDLAEKVLNAFKAKGKMLAAAESCTGGMVAAALTDIAGSSAVVERGFVTYSNRAKAQLLGIDPAVIEAHGAVSQQVAEAMARGALAQSATDVAVAVTGIAGPDGGSADKPVGLVWFGLAAAGTPTTTDYAIFKGNRAEVRQQATEKALALLLEGLNRLK